MTEGKIFNIQRFSIHDGPGIRTTVFFKGCNLRCKWCHNPESFSSRKQIEIHPYNCIGCGKCFQICPNKAHYIDENGNHRIDRKKCTGCGECTNVCFTDTLISIGKTVNVESLMKSILTDLDYYSSSGGGVTFSGGECMLQIEFLNEILTECKRRNIHTAVDTAGAVQWKNFKKILGVTDLFLYDVKAADSEIHKKLTGVDNGIIIENLRKLSEVKAEIIIRIPYVVGLNEDQIEGISNILEPLNISKVEVLPYHKLGNSKYEALEMNNKSQELEIPSDKMIEKAVKILRSKNINAIKA